MSPAETPLNHVGQGMWPLNWASRLSKETSDLMFSLAVNDRESVEARIRVCRELLDELEKACLDARGASR